MAYYNSNRIVLLIDDDPIQFGLLKRWLPKDNVHWLPNVYSAVDFIGQFGEDAVDLVLIDQFRTSMIDDDLKKSFVEISTMVRDCYIISSNQEITKFYTDKFVPKTDLKAFLKSYE